MNMVLYSSAKNKYDHKRILCICLCLLVFLTSFNLSHAVSQFAEQPIPISSEGAYLVGTNSQGYTLTVQNKTGRVPMYCFLYPSNNTQVSLVICYEYDEGSNQEFNYKSFGSTYYSSDYIRDLNTAYNLKYNENYVYNNSDVTWNAPYFDSLNIGLAAVRNYIDNGDAWSGPATVSVEAGCVAYILVDGGRAEISTTFPELSKLSRPMWVTGTTYTYESDLPSSGKVFNSTTGTVVDWLKPAEAKTDLLGRTYQAARPLSDLPSGQYLVIYNPVYRGYDDKGVGIMSPTVYVTLTNYAAVRQYRLTASYNGGLIESTSEDGYTSWFDSIGEEELDSNGNPIYIEHKTDGTTSSAITIPSGGGNIVVDTENADNSLGGLLQRLVNLLSAPIRYIEKLFNAGVGFFTMLASLWSWLPEEVSTIIASALVVLVVVGVVKFLWK